MRIEFNVHVCMAEEVAACLASFVTFPRICFTLQHILLQPGQETASLPDERN
jgi:hypothetical protein